MIATRLGVCLTDSIPRNRLIEIAAELASSANIDYSVHSSIQDFIENTLDAKPTTSAHILVGDPAAIPAESFAKLEQSIDQGRIVRILLFPNSENELRKWLACSENNILASVITTIARETLGRPNQILLTLFQNQLTIPKRECSRLSDVLLCERRRLAGRLHDVLAAFLGNLVQEIAANKTTMRKNFRELFEILHRYETTVNLNELERERNIGRIEDIDNQLGTLLRGMQNLGIEVEQYTREMTMILRDLQPDSSGPIAVDPLVERMILAVQDHLKSNCTIEKKNHSSTTLTINVNLFAQALFSILHYICGSLLAEGKKQNIVLTTKKYPDEFVLSFECARFKVEPPSILPRTMEYYLEYLANSFKVLDLHLTYCKKVLEKLCAKIEIAPIDKQRQSFRLIFPNNPY